ncbi:MAG: chorismate lyase [Acinetobacter sp.]|nr:chorismate lyase [Acinetobacter sp.]MDO9621259.1 chorismate lyase [Moraxellaceae bacterium]
MPNPLGDSRWPQPKRWYSREQLLKPPNVLLMHWLQLPGSLTAALSQLAKGDLKVKVIFEGWHKPTLAERQQLGLPHDRLVWIREVELIGQGQPWVHARSLLPARSLNAAGQRLTRLGNRSLGSVLFKHPALKRRGVEFSQLNHPAGKIWARRSRLEVHGHAVFVAEAFLPALLAYYTSR